MTYIFFSAKYTVIDNQKFFKMGKKKRKKHSKKKWDKGLKKVKKNKANKKKARKEFRKQIYWSVGMENYIRLKRR